MKNTRKEKIFRAFLILLNLAGVIAGFYYYYPQFSQVPFYLWFFVPDCPLYVLFFTLTLLIKTPEWFKGITSVGMIKYAAWSLFYYFLHPESLFLFPNFAGFFAHTFMIFEGLYFLKNAGVNWKISAPWFLFNDWLDYFMGTRPILLNEPFFTSLLAFSIGATLILSALKTKNYKKHY